MTFAWESSDESVTDRRADGQRDDPPMLLSRLQSVYAGSPNFEIATILYVATFVLLTIPEVEYLTRFFQLQRPT
jgi:hypothetical protein